MKRILNAYADAYRGLPLAVWHLALVLLVNRTGSMVLAFLSLYLTFVCGFELTFAGQVLAVYGLGSVAGSFLGGWLCDHLGPIRIQIWSFVVSGLGYLALGQARSAPAIVAVTFVTALAAEAFRPANAAALAAYSPPALRLRAVALNRMALSLGMAIGPALGGFLAAYDYALLFLVDGGTCLVAAALTVLLFRGRSPVELDSGDEPNAGQGRHPLADRPFLVFVALSSIFAFCLFQGWSTYPVYLKEFFGVSELQFGTLISVNAALILAFEMVLTHRFEVFHPIAVFGAGTFFLCAGFAILPYGSGYGFALGSVVVWTFGEMLAAPSSYGWVANRASAGHRGKYMGLFTVGWGVAFAIAPAVGTWIYDQVSPDAVWYVVGALGGVAWLGCRLLRRWADV